MSHEIKTSIPPGTEPARCRACRGTIYWVITATGRRMPVDPDGVSHSKTCALESRRKK